MNSTVPAFWYPQPRATRTAASPIADTTAAGRSGGGRLLDQFLVPALDRAVTRPQVDDVAVGVGEDLDLHVAGPGEVLLEVALRAPKALLGLPLGRLQGVCRLGWRRDHPHAPAAAAERRFDGHGPPERLAELDHLAGVRQRRAGPGHGGHARSCGRRPAADLVPHDLDRLGRRPHPGRSCLDDGLGKAGVLGQETVARMDGVGVRTTDDVDEPVDRQVALRRARATQEVSLVGHSHVHGSAVGLGVDGQ